MHRRCAGLSKASYEAATGSATPFYCPHCRLDSHETEIASLKCVIQQLVEDVRSLGAELRHKAEADTSKSTKDDDASCTSKITYSQAVKVQVDRTPHFSSQVPQSKPGSPGYSYASSKPKDSSSDRKYNIIIHGISECPPGTPRPTRATRDLESAVSAINELIPTLSSQSVRDCFRLGKYKRESHRPRPILVKMVRSVDVITLLAKRGVGNGQVRIKPDLSLEDRLTETILLKKRWDLMSSGVLKKDIRLGRSNLYVKNSLHGRVVNGSYIPQHTTSAAKPPNAECTLSADQQLGPSTTRCSNPSSVVSLTAADKQESPLSSTCSISPPPNSHADGQPHD